MDKCAKFLTSWTPKILRGPNTNQVVGLGNTYRVSLSLRLNLDSLSYSEHHLLSVPETDHDGGGDSKLSQFESCLVFLFFSKYSLQLDHSRKGQVKPFKFQVSLDPAAPEKQQKRIVEKTIEFKLTVAADQNSKGSPSSSSASQSVGLDVSESDSFCSRFAATLFAQNKQTGSTNRHLAFRHSLNRTF